MNPSAIYSKSGKGVQEAAGKTSLLSRPDRAVLSAIDGRATLADVAQKVGQTYDPAFVKLIGELDKGGFIREVSPGTAASKPAAGAKPGAKPSAPTAPMDAVSDLDFTHAMSSPLKSAKPLPPPQAPPRATPPPPKHTVTIPPAPPPPSAADKAKAERVAKEQQDAFAKAREEAERKAQEDRTNVKAETEAKMRAETEAKLRAETEAKLRAEAEAKAAAEAEAKVKAAREAAVRAVAEAKAKAEAEAKRAREESERARKEAEAKAERARKEAEEKARREQEELKRRLEEERRAREEAERKAKEEEQARRAERRKREQEEEERERAEQEARRRAQEEETERPKAETEKPKAKEKEPAAAKPAGGGFADSLLADLESFTNRDDEERKAKEEEERKAKEEAARRAREAEERRAKEEAERQERESKERRKKEEEEELRAREEKEKARLKDEEDQRKREAEEREKKAKKEERLEAKATRGAGAFNEDAELRSKRERELAAKPKTVAAAAKGPRKGWGKPIAITLLLILVVAIGVAHVMPIDTSDYERAATDALGRPVKIASANLSLITGVQLKFNDVSIGEGTRIATVRAYPELDSLLGPKKNFSRIELEGVKLEQQAIGEALFAKVKSDNFSVARVVAKQLELTGPLKMPKGLEADLAFDPGGTVRSATLRGPEALLARLAPKDSAVEVEMSAASFTLPFAPGISLGQFAMKGTVTPQGMSVSEWDGALLNGTLSGTANVRWGEIWIVDGVVTARNINAAVFAPALLSEGKAEGSGKFSMRGAEPGKLANAGRLEGSFTISRGVLGSFDLSRAIQTGGRQATGRTQFTEMNGQGVYDRGVIALRNVTLGAGQLNAGASADIAQNGALSGRIVADVRIASQTLRATLNLAGTLKEPQVRN